MNKVLLGSSSQSRQMLLQKVGIPYQVVGHTADEQAVPLATTLQETVAAIARFKMEHVILANAAENAVAYVLTADTMGTDSAGIVHGKPVDRADAIVKIKACRDGVLITSTAFCLEKRAYIHGAWQVLAHHQEVVTAKSVFYVPDAWLDRYLEHSQGLIASGGVAIELYGAQFLKSINGSYSTVVGLPLYEVREALERMNFFNVTPCF